MKPAELMLCTVLSLPSTSKSKSCSPPEIASREASSFGKTTTGHAISFSTKPPSELKSDKDWILLGQICFITSISWFTGSPVSLVVLVVSLTTVSLVSLSCAREIPATTTKNTKISINNDFLILAPPRFESFDHIRIFSLYSLPAYALCPTIIFNQKKLIKP